FVSGGRRHASFACDWSSDVCASDLPLGGLRQLARDLLPHLLLLVIVELPLQLIADYVAELVFVHEPANAIQERVGQLGQLQPLRSEERRVGKRGWPCGAPCSDLPCV